MQACSKAILLMLCTFTSAAFAADPTNIEELKAHFESLEIDRTSFTTDYAMTMAGQTTIIGSRMPPSYSQPLPARSGMFDVG